MNNRAIHQIGIGCCAFAFRWLDFAHSLRLASDLGFEYVDVGANQLGQARIVADPDSISQEIRDGAAAHHLKLEEFFVTQVQVDGAGVLPNEPDETVVRRMLENFRRLCACAGQADFTSIMAVPGSPLVNPAEDWDRAVATLSQMGDIAAAAGLIFTVEPHIGSIIDTPQKALRLVDDVPGLRYTLDYSHYIGQHFSINDILPLNTYAAHLHAKPCAPGVPKCLFDEADFDWDPILLDLHQQGWRGVIATEYIGRADVATLTAHPSFQNILLARAVSRSRERAEKI